ncbi:energy transducer TonB [Polaribacter sp. SA4-12]|uniref:energy transducer TonB n=1 Tax=Polaribacter sp. SA4-12 TaxID=1312072 RepID=UPI0012FACAE6|nr:energy transducer TonB [Polaribacter sp. SA4-12]
MKKIVTTVILMIITFVGFSQKSSYYKVGDTLYYENNRATYGKTNTLVILKETNVANDTYKVEKYLLDESKNTYILDSKFTTNGLQILMSNGDYISYHKNGKKASEGQTVNGKKGAGIWTYFYPNGEKKCEQKEVSENYFNDKVKKVMVNFWDEKGRQTVKKGNGFVQYKDDDGLLIKGSYKKGVRNETWTAFDGKVKKYEETYKKGVLTKGTSWNTEGASFDYKEVFAPAYYKKNDKSSVRKYVDNNFKPKKVGVGGDINVKFLITKEGLVQNVNIIRGLTGDYNTEVKRVLSEMKGWFPAKKRGQAYDSTYSLDLHFSE